MQKIEQISFILRHIGRIESKPYSRVRDQFSQKRILLAYGIRH